MDVILQFTHLFVYIHTLLVIYKPSDSYADKVYISQNLTGLMGKNDIQLTCSLIDEQFERTSSVQFFIKNQTDEFDLRKPIAIMEPDKLSEFLSSGNYLNGRVTLTNITEMSTNATLTFNVLKCEDEKDYMCLFTYKLSEGGQVLERSPLTRISVRASSSKPDKIASILSSQTETKGYSTSIFNTSLSTKRDAILKTTTPSIDTVTTTHLKVTANLPLVYNGEDNVTFTCTGDIGNPPGKLIWQKKFPKGQKPITYSNETTYIEEVPGKCSFKGTSQLMVKIYAEDITATICCFEESQVNETDMYLETEPFDVLFQVNHVDTNKQPNLQHYNTETDHITLSCKFRGIGNPQPSYIWFKEGKHNSILSNISVYVIENVIRNNSGVYICEVYNIIDDITYRKSNSVEIHIVDDLQSSQETDWWNFVEEHQICFICGGVGFIVLCAVIIIVCCIRQKKKKNKARCSQKTKSVGITLSTEYATVIRKNIATSGDTGDSMLVLNNMERNKDKSRNKYVVI